MIPNPFPNETPLTRVMTNMDKTQYEYFFRHVVPDRGSRGSILNILLSALYHECIAQDIKPCWDPTNEPRLIAILSRINFRTGPVSGAGHTPTSNPRTGTRRKHDTGATPKVRAGATQTGAKPGNV